MNRFLLKLLKRLSFLQIAPSSFALGKSLDFPSLRGINVYH